MSREDQLVAEFLQDLARVSSLHGVARDTAREAVIAQLTNAIAMTGSPRLARIQQQAIRERSPEQVAHMERQQGLEERRQHAIANSRRRQWR